MGQQQILQNDKLSRDHLKFGLVCLLRLNMLTKTLGQCRPANLCEEVVEIGNRLGPKPINISKMSIIVNGQVVTFFIEVLL
jgi:hypothetical protein